MTGAGLEALRLHADNVRLRAEVSARDAMLCEAREHVCRSRARLDAQGLFEQGDAATDLIHRIDAALSPAVPTRPDLSSSQSPPPSEDSGGQETP